ncbi:hypothetical protein [Salinimicrobium sp. GXAS 041]|uniref:hypothetical protein n=1 Tax=Salinimicrobium sp. GXAS 041 TaxID=3400806 RepID=UPI003C71DA8A
MSKDLPISLLYISPVDQGTDLFNKLHEVNAQVVHYANSIEAIQFLQNNRVSAILIEHPVAPVKTEDTLSFLRGELGLKVPVYIYRYNGAQDQLPEYSSYDIILPDDFVIEKIMDHMEESEVVAQPKIYSLDYLKEISGDNEEFIMQSIQIFIDSVKANLEMAKEAYDRGEYEEIGQIAHAIKPSYEMLKNKEAPPICDELTYSRVDEKISSQLSELDRIYENISFQLNELLEKNYEKNFGGRR